MADIDIAALANLLQEAAVTEILPRFRNLGHGDVRMKTEAIDLVTEADEAAERLIHSRIKELMPDAVFIGEEAVAADPALLDKLADAALAVVVDPIDGTLQFCGGPAAVRGHAQRRTSGRNGCGPDLRPDGQRLGNR